MSRGTSLARGSESRAKHALSALCERGLPVRVFGQELRARLRALLEFDAYCLNTCDIESGVVTSSVGDGLSPEQARALFELEADGCGPNLLRDLHRGPLRAGALSLSTGGRPEQCRRMREIFLPLGFSDELRAALVTHDVCYGYLHLFRGRERAAFSAADLTEVTAQSPLIARALRPATALVAKRLAAASSVGLPFGTELILLDDADRVLERSPGAEIRLGITDTLHTESGLPHVLRDVASRSRRGGDAHATLATDRVKSLSVTALQLGSHTAIVLDEPSAAQSLALGLAAFALTAREREVARLVAAGHSNQAIASELGIRLYTVKDHVKAVLAKTRSANRNELAARLRGAE
jgi:DNA-binding CsgD family transcriptional regulator